MRLAIAIILSILLPAAIYCQTGASISGTVTDEKGPVAGAAVTAALKGDRTAVLTTTTNGKGEFVLRPKAAGEYLLSASVSRGSENGVSEARTVTVEIAAGSTSNVELRIQAYTPIRETVSVNIASDSPQPIDAVSKTVNIITGQEMRERADLGLAESLRSIPGFRVQQLGGFGKTASIKTRGLRNQDTAILLDGVRLRDASAITGDASPFLSDLTLTSVSRVEVLRGSGSSLYGTNAIGGTVDLETPLPQPGPHGQLSYAGGQLGLHRFRGNISDATKDRNFGYNFAVARTVYTEGIDGDDDAHNTNVQSRIEYSPFSKTNISGRFFVSDAYVRLNANPDTFGVLPASNSVVIDARPFVNFTPDADDPDANQKSKFFNGQIVLTQVLNSKATVRAYYSGLKTSRKNDNGVLGPGFQSASTSFFDGTIQTASATLNWSPNSLNDIKGGYEFEHEKFGNRGFTPTGFDDFFTRATQSSHTFFVQDVLSLLDGRLQLAGGARGQIFSLGKPTFSISNAPYSGLNLSDPPAAYTFDGAASYFISQTGTKLRAHIGNGYRVPSLYERFGTFFSSFGGAAFFALGDPALKPEKTIAFDAGVEQYLAREKVKLTGVYFYTKLIDTIGFGNVVPDIGTTTRPFGGYENQKGGTARGGEFSGSIKPTSSTDVFASYTFTDSVQRAPQVSGSGITETLGIPRHQFTLVATQRIKRFWVNLDLLAASDYLAPIFSNSSFSTYVYRFRGNRRADVTAGYTFVTAKDRVRIRVFGTIENLFNDRYYENGFATASRNARAGVSLGF